jgi:hypothetical protein
VGSPVCGHFLISSPLTVWQLSLVPLMLVRAVIVSIVILMIVFVANRLSGVPFLVSVLRSSLEFVVAIGLWLAVVAGLWLTVVAGLLVFAVVSAIGLSVALSVALCVALRAGDGLGHGGVGKELSHRDIVIVHELGDGDVVGLKEFSN